MSTTSQLCERAREWASLRADGELSELESALLDAHLGRCAPCRSFAGGAEDLTAALRAARLERPAPLALVLPRRRPALKALQAVLATAFVVAAGVSAALVGVDRHASSISTAEPVAVVAAAESPDTYRRLRRPLLLAPEHQLPRNGRVPIEAA
jgi:ferric-dicitrate binding protein FerR (iron transport regulator)